MSKYPHAHHPRHEYSDYEEGTLTVSSSGEVKINLNFVPQIIEAIFIDPDPDHHACDVSTPDVIEVITFQGKSFDIEWEIKSTRVIKWIAATLKP